MPATHQPAARPDIIVVGASAGGVEALRHVAAGLPADLPAAVLVVLHVAATGRSVLGEILDRASAMHCAAAVDGEPLVPGRLYAAPPNCHLVVRDGHVQLDLGPRVNGHRPAIDPLFRTAADAYGERCCGVVLSGMRDDGTIGLAAVKQAGGTALVQDPDDAVYPSMPESALMHVQVDAVLPAARIGPALTALVTEGRLPDGPPSGSTTAPSEAPTPVHPAPICPECGGRLDEESVSGVSWFRCHVGHAYAPLSLAAAQADAVERALWASIRALQERAALLRRMAADAARGGRPRSGAGFARNADEAERHVQELHAAIGTVREPTP